MVSGELLLEDEIIAGILDPGTSFPPGTRKVDVSGCIIAPGFIDTHVHGGLGHSFMEATPESFVPISDYLAQGGVTSCLLTTTSASLDQLLNVFSYLGSCEDTLCGGSVDVLGVHLEGPFLNPQFRGVHVEEYIREPKPEELNQLWKSGNELLKVITLAPEVPGGEAAVDFFARRGVQVSIGHSGACYEDTRKMLARGVRRSTHLFNALPPIHHRRPGPVTALLEDGSAFLELVADGRHVHPSVIALTISLAGPDRVVLVSDGTDVAGQVDGAYTRWEGTEVVLTNGQAFTRNGSLAGSTIRLSDAVANLVNMAGVRVEDALRMAAETPARAIGELERKGSLAPGKDADVVVLDGELSVSMTIALGRVLYDRRTCNEDSTRSC